MKRIVSGALILVLLAVALTLTARRVILAAAKSGLANFFPDSEVSIKDLRLTLPCRLVFTDVAVERKGIYGFEAGVVYADFGLFALLTGRVARAGLTDAFLNISTPQKNIADFVQYFNLQTHAGGGLRVDTIGLENVNINVTAKDVLLNSTLSLEYFLADVQAKAVAVSIPTLEGYGVKVENIFIESGDRPGELIMAVERLAVNKGVINGIDGIVTLEGGAVFLEFLSTQAFAGRLEGNVTLDVSGQPEYLAELRLTDVAIDRLVEDFELSDKFFMDGKISGDLVLQGKGPAISVLNGHFSTALGGGKLIITDTRFLENIAKGTNQPLDILVESFRNYHYNTGNIGLSLAEGSIMLDLALEGETGKRNLTITLHDFF